MTQKLAMRLSLAIAISSGAHPLGAIKVQQESNSDEAVNTVFPDSNKTHRSDEY